VRRRLVPRQHAGRDHQIAWHLSAHSTYEQHFLFGVRMKGRVKEIFGLPQLVLAQIGRQHFGATIVFDNRLGLVQRTIRRENIKRICGDKEVLSAAYIR